MRLRPRVRFSCNVKRLRRGGYVIVMRHMAPREQPETAETLDLIADEEFLGKPAGSDIGEGVYTLPVLYAAEGPAGAEIRELLTPEAPTDQAVIDRVIELTASGGYVHRVIDEATEHMALAEKASDRIAGGSLSPVLRNLDSYILGRVEAARG